MKVKMLQVFKWLASFLITCKAGGVSPQGSLQNPEANGENLLQEMEANYQEQIQQMEKQLQRRSRVFRPLKKKPSAVFEAFAEKIDIESVARGLKKTNSRFLLQAKQEHERTVTRGEEIFGIRPV